MTIDLNAAIPPASVIGRIGKLVVGAAQVWFSVISIRYFRPLTTPSLDTDVWLFTAIGVALIPFAVNLGYRRVLDTGLRPLWPVLTVALALAVWDGLRIGVAWGPSVASLLLAVALYAHLHVGISHLLAAASGLPGCEMRVIPYYLTRMRGAAETAPLCLCPGCWTPIDRWEARLKERLA